MIRLLGVLLFLAAFNAASQSYPAEFLKFAQVESDKLGTLIRDNGIKVE